MSPPTPTCTSAACSFGVEPDIAVIVPDERDWESRQPYGLPFFNDDHGQIRPGVVVMPAGSGEFWWAMGQDLHEASPRSYRRLLSTYPDGGGGLDLQPFFDLVTIHELGHAFEVLGDLRLPTFWLGEIFANLALHAFVATGSRNACGRWRCSPPWGRRVGASALGCVRRGTAHWRSSRPTTQVVTTR